ncbi:hypothetical protein N7488_000365 [Penicillium malachiteum]|nr:hypothetical protein N7488_000365 [Penicillium malachiteum]
MDQLRNEARQALQKDPNNLPDLLPSAMSVDGDLQQLWQNVSQYDNSTYFNACESLLTALNFVEGSFHMFLPEDEKIRQLEGDEAQTAINLSKWASSLALPSSEFASSFDDTIEVTEDIKKAQEECRVKGNLAIEFLHLLSAKINPCFNDREISQSLDVIMAMATFATKQDPWATDDTIATASSHLSVAGQKGGLWPKIEAILKDKIRPLFTKQRNPKITSEGRKNFHPVPLARFDGSVLDDSTRPWKNTDIYATSVLSWIISQYEATDKIHLESHFPLIVPAILSLIDDSNISFKTQGCQLLTQILKPIRESGSDILIRTNLFSVFEEAITPCLLSLPTITPEPDSLKILGAAYPVLIALLEVAYKTHLPRTPQSQVKKDKENFNTSLAKILRSNLISSFNHISSSSSISGSNASFPHPRLSTFLMTTICGVLNKLGIETTKYLQDIIPVLQITLSNPFGTAYPPLLSAAVFTTRAVILNAHPRVWKWRGELLAALCACWLQVSPESKDKGKELDDVSKQLWITVSVLKYALQNPVAINNGTLDPDQLHAKEHMNAELKELVDAEPQLERLLCRDATP